MSVESSTVKANILLSLAAQEMK